MTSESRLASQREYDRKRASDPARKLYKTAQWLKLRQQKLSMNPYCECDFCVGNKRRTLATVVDHKIPHKGDHALFFDYSNLRSLSKSCHDSKTATEDGGFGRPRGARKVAFDANGYPIGEHPHW